MDIENIGIAIGFLLIIGGLIAWPPTFMFLWAKLWPQQSLAQQKLSYPDVWFWTYGNLGNAIIAVFLADVCLPFAIWYVCVKMWEHGGGSDKKREPFESTHA
jgi:hypothetical protein